VQVGFSEDSITELRDTALGNASYKLQERIDVITICWSTVFLVDTLPTAIVHHAKSLALRDVSVTLKYSGWTVDAYLDRKYTSKLSSVSTVARSPAWLKAMHYGLMDQLLEWGEKKET